MYKKNLCDKCSICFQTFVRKLYKNHTKLNQIYILLLLYDLSIIIFYLTANIKKNRSRINKYIFAMLNFVHANPILQYSLNYDGIMIQLSLSISQFYAFRNFQRKKIGWLEITNMNN